MIDDTYRARLLKLAREALEARVRGTAAPFVPDDLNLPASGLFVTIHYRGELRGCLGTLDGRELLGAAIQRLAADVSREDYRFPPIVVHELSGVEIDLSVLTPPLRVHDPIVEIQIGRDGLIAQQGKRRGLLLPQVATQYGWDCETFLAHTCIKAGLARDAWRRGAEILRFEAEVFGEVEPTRQE